MDGDSLDLVSLPAFPTTTDTKVLKSDPSVDTVSLVASALAKATKADSGSKSGSSRRSSQVDSRWLKVSDVS